MALKSFSAIPKNLREWSIFFDNLVVSPDELTVDTSKLKNKAVTYAKVQDVTADRLLGRTGSVGTVQEISLGGGVEFAGAALQRSALTGDVTAGAASGTTAIANAVVTYAKIQNVTSGVLLGRTTALAGSLEEITPTAPLSVAAGHLAFDTSVYVAASAVLNGSATFDPPSLADGAGSTTTVAVTGAVLGDYALASFSLDLQGIGLTAYVSAADTVSVRFQNESGGTLNLGSGTLKARVWKQ